MQRGRAPFSIQKRPANKKEAEKKRQGKAFRHVYYVQFRDSNGDYTSAISSGQTSEGAAKEWALNYARKGNIPIHRGFTFAQYAADWWVPGKCKYCKEKVQTGRTLTARYIVESRRNLEKRLIPHFGSMKLTGIRRKDVWEWKNALYEEGTLNPATINRTMATLKVMLKEAVRDEYIQANPSADIGILRETPKSKTILSSTEAKKLFTRNALADAWNSNLTMFTMNLVAATTGMRLGEIKAVQHQDIHDGFIEVRHSWSERIGLKDTKNHETRTVPLMKSVQHFIKELSAHSVDDKSDSFVFHQHDAPRPYSTKDVDDALYAAMEKVGISAKERKSRNIVFHSWRYFFNTLCRTRGILTRIVMGHKTISMTDRYTSPPISELNAVLVLEDAVFAPKRVAKSTGKNP